jgi:hypothetical protein
LNGGIRIVALPDVRQPRDAVNAAERQKTVFLPPLAIRFSFPKILSQSEFKSQVFALVLPYTTRLAGWNTDKALGIIAFPEGERYA